MPQRAATTVEQYLAELPDDRREVVATVRDAMRRRMPDGYHEGVAWGMIGWTIPLERYPDTYNGEPLVYVSLAAQKNHYALYLVSVYQDPAQEGALRETFARAGKRLDMGKSCVRFRRLEDIPLDDIAELVGRTTPDQFIAGYERARARAASAKRER
jgi:uncharacterized protein YdhG (YjbR/CyaY superfamily)